jgi:hypothetical protein
LKILAEAYPNQATRRAYLTLYDEKVAKTNQLFSLSTWQNLYNLRVMQKMKNLIPYDFKRNLVSTRKQLKAQRVIIPPPLPGRRVIDISPKEAAEELSRAIHAEGGEDVLNGDGSGQMLPPVDNTQKIGGPVTDDLVNDDSGPTFTAPSAANEQPKKQSRGAGGKFGKTSGNAPKTNMETPTDQEFQKFD